MSNTVVPKIGAWFKNENGDEFEVVAIDDEDATIEIQHFDGTIEEFDNDQWHDSLIIAIEPPEDWSGSYDMEKEDYGVDLENQSPTNRQNPLEKLE